jgi:hypothetical protein
VPAIIVEPDRDLQQCAEMHFYDFVSRQGQEIFLFFFQSVQTGSGVRLASSPMDTVSPFSRESSSWGVKLITHLVPWPRMVELYLHYRIRLYDVVLNLLSIGTPLPW